MFCEKPGDGRDMSSPSVHGGGSSYSTAVQAAASLAAQKELMKETHVEDCTLGSYCISKLLMFLISLTSRPTDAFPMNMVRESEMATTLS